MHSPLQFAGPSHGVPADEGKQTDIDAGGSIAVIALDDTAASSFVGSVGIGGGAAGVGGSVSVLVISKDTRATVGDQAVLTSRGTATAIRIRRETACFQALHRASGGSKSGELPEGPGTDDRQPRPARRTRSEGLARFRD